MAVTVFGQEQEIPAETIAIWPEPLADIPPGWVICDGNNGTPNLLDKFARGVVDGTTDPGATGGSNSKTLSTSQMASHSHGGSSSTDGSHTDILTDFGVDEIDNQGDPRHDSSKTFDRSKVQSAGSHNHSLSIDNTGSDSSYDNRPNTYEVAYIMKT